MFQRLQSKRIGIIDNKTLYTYFIIAWAISFQFCYLSYLNASMVALFSVFSGSVMFSVGTKPFFNSVQ